MKQFTKQDIEKIAAEVHNAWWEEKKKQGFHSPMKHEGDIIFDPIYDKFYKICDKCHTDMYPYDELPENIKEYDRITVKAVLNAMAKVKL